MSFTCAQCGKVFDEASDRCPVCHASTQSDTETCDAVVRALLHQARQRQQDGDIAAALRAAREALTLHADCTTTHALLGHLYEQQGNDAAARYHFQAALHVTPESAPAEISLPTPMVTAAHRPPQTGIMMFVLIGCVLFSGMASLFAFRSGHQRIEQGAIFQIPPKPRAASTISPRWTWKVPTPAPQSDPASPVSPATEAPMSSNGTTRVTVATSTPADTSTDQAVMPPPSNGVLGPSAHTRVTAEVARPTLEAADQAYFRGEYDRAITMYETIAAQSDGPSPRVFRDLAWCYQQLGNSPKAADYLGKAIQGYKSVLATDPNSLTAQQGVQTCEAALRTLLTTREQDAKP